jgi:hypothetical protein
MRQSLWTIDFVPFGENAGLIVMRFMLASH